MCDEIEISVYGEVNAADGNVSFDSIWIYWISNQSVGKCWTEVAAGESKDAFILLTKCRDEGTPY